MESASQAGVDAAKRAAAIRALDFVRDGMCLGLGSGSTAMIFVRELGELIKRKGWNLTCVSTSDETTETATEAGLDLVPLNECGIVDIAFDGADEFTLGFELLKGGGGALLYEKIVSNAANEMVVIVDSKKKVRSLGSFPLPVEVSKFGWKSTRSNLIDFFAADYPSFSGDSCKIRGGSSTPFVTDDGNYILDCSLGQIREPDYFEYAINSAPGVVENGLFIGLASSVLIGMANGDVVENHLPEVSVPL